MTRPLGRVRHGAWDVTEDVRLLTYDEISVAFSITRESARQLVIRKRWTRRKGNDGKARIEVPEDAFACTGGTSDDTGRAPSDDTCVSTSSSTGEAPADSTGRDTSDLSAAVVILERHTSRLEAELAAIRETLATVSVERDEERVRAGQVAVLQAVLDVERTRLGEARADAECWRAEADRWREIATAPRGFRAWFRRA